MDYKRKNWELNQLTPPDAVDKKEKYMREVFAECGDNCYIDLPFWANWGGHHLHLGNNVYINFNLTLVDDGEIYIGNNVIIGPNVTITTTNHYIDPQKRKEKEIKNVYIEDNVWIGANVTILPGIIIGKNSVIGAGSIVTKDIPENVVAVGNPCKIIKTF